MSNRPPRDQPEQRRAALEKLTAHRGMATWGERLVPLGRFRDAVAESGRSLSEVEREAERRGFVSVVDDGVPVEGPFERVAVFGGVYNNHYGLAALLEDAAGRGCEAIYCLGDLGGFGPSPEKVPPLLAAGEVLAIQGNYEESLAAGAEDCNCGYTDPRDNHFARVSYTYTFEHSPEEPPWAETSQVEPGHRADSRQ